MPSKNACNTKCRSCLNVKAASKLFNIHRATLWRIVTSNDIKKIKIGRETMVCRIKLEDYFRPIEHGPTHKPRKNTKREQEALEREKQCLCLHPHKAISSKWSMDNVF